GHRARGRRERTLADGVHGAHREAVGDAGVDVLDLAGGRRGLREAGGAVGRHEAAVVRQDRHAAGGGGRGPGEGDRAGTLHLGGGHAGGRAGHGGRRHRGGGGRERAVTGGVGGAHHEGVGR